MFDGESSAVEGENEEGAEQPPQHDVFEFMQHGNAGDFDQCNLQEAAELIENIDDDNAPAPENIPTTAPTDTIFRWRHSGQCEREKDDVNNVQPQLNISHVGEEELTEFKIFELLLNKKLLRM